MKNQPACSLGRRFTPLVTAYRHDLLEIVYQSRHLRVIVR